jgi:hypothetical protein
MGAEPMCSLGDPPPYLTEPGTRNPSDFDKWAAYCAGYVGLWRKHDPDFRLVQIWNEPNASWFRDQRTGHGGPSDSDLFITMANKVAGALKQRFPGLLIGGPVLCWPPAWPPDQRGQRPWYTWNNWTIPWLKGTRDTVDFFDFHVYDIAPAELAVQTEMLENEARLVQNRRLPIRITESNYTLKPDQATDPKAIWADRILPYERYLLHGILPETDKIDGNLYHDLHAKQWALLPDGADDPSPVYWLFWVLRDLRGVRVAADSGDPAVVSYASLEDDRVTVVLFNDSDKAREVPLSVSMPCGYWTGPDVRAIGQGPDSTCQRLIVQTSLSRKGKVADGTVALPAHATASLSFRMDTFPTPAVTRSSREYFGDATLQLLAGQQRAVVDIDVPDAPAGVRFWLRVGLLGPAGDEALAARWNGADLPIAATTLQDLPLEDESVKPHNHLDVWLSKPSDNTKLALGFASVVVETTRPQVQTR